MSGYAQQRGFQRMKTKDDDLPKDPLRDFTAIYETHHSTIYRYILARVGTIEDAQDVTGQVFLKAYQHSESYTGKAPMIYWLIGIARRCVIDHYRRNKPNLLLSDAIELPDSAPSLEDGLEQRNRLKRVSDALGALSEDRREAITLRLFAGLSNSEIADLMGKTIEAIAMLIHRGIQDLKIRLGGELS